MTRFCDHCEMGIAVCFGAYEGRAVEAACNSCCAHGNEDGWCVMIADTTECQTCEGAGTVDYVGLGETEACEDCEGLGWVRK